MYTEEEINDTISEMIDALSAEFGVTLTTEDRNEVVSNTKRIAASMEASRPKSTKSS